MGTVVSCLLCWRDSFFAAVKEGNRAAVQRILEDNVDVLKSRTTVTKRTAWHMAAERGHADVLKDLCISLRESTGIHHLGPAIQRLLPRGMDIEEYVSKTLNQSTRLGHTPIMLACKNGYANCVEVLVTEGASPWLGDHLLGMTCLHHAALHNHLSCVHALLASTPGPPNASVRRLSACRHHDSIKFVDVPDNSGYSALHYAVWAGNEEIIQALISYNANIICRSTAGHMEWLSVGPGYTPLHMAAVKGNLNVVKLVLRAYYESSADLLTNVTGVLTAVERRRRARSHPDPRLILNKSGRLPYHVAHRWGHTTLLDWLDPSIPLMFLFQSVDPDVRTVGPPRLSVIAATALHSALLGHLDRVEQQLIKRREEAKHVSDQDAIAKKGGTNDSLDKSKETEGLLRKMLKASLPSIHSPTLSRQSSRRSTPVTTATPSNAATPTHAADQVADVSSRSAQNQDRVLSSFTSSHSMSSPLDTPRVNPRSRLPPLILSETPTGSPLARGLGTSSSRRLSIGNRSRLGNDLQGSRNSRNLPLPLLPESPRSANSSTVGELVPVVSVTPSLQNGAQTIPSSPPPTPVGGFQVQHPASSLQSSLHMSASEELSQSTSTLPRSSSQRMKRKDTNEDRDNKKSDSRGLIGNLKHKLKKMSNTVKPVEDDTILEENGDGLDEEDMCPVCLDATPDIAINKCGHTLCVDCAKDLVKRHKLCPALCPYCRTIIAGFKAR